MDRRAFLKTIGAGLYAAAVPAILLPTRTVIDMMPRYHELWAQDGDDLTDLMRYLAPGGTLFVHGVWVTESKPIYFGREHRLDMLRSRLTYNHFLPGAALNFMGGHVSGRPHVVMYSILMGNNTLTGCSFGIRA